MKKNNEAYSTKLLKINPASVDWGYILKNDKVVELLDSTPEESQVQIRELFYETMIGISLYFKTREDIDLETIKTCYPELPTLIKELIKEGINKGELYAMDYIYSMGDARLYAEYQNKLPAYITATAGIAAELKKLDTAQPKQEKAIEIPSFEDISLRGDALIAQMETTQQQMETTQQQMETTQQQLETTQQQLETTQQWLARKEQDTPQPKRKQTKVAPPLPSLKSLLRGDDDKKKQIIEKIINSGSMSCGKYLAGVYDGMIKKGWVKKRQRSDGGNKYFFEVWCEEFDIANVESMASMASQYLNEKNSSYNLEEKYKNNIITNLGL